MYEIMMALQLIKSANPYLRKHALNTLDIHDLWSVQAMITFAYNTPNYCNTSFQHPYSVHFLELFRFLPYSSAIINSKEIEINMTNKSIILIVMTAELL